MINPMMTMMISCNRRGVNIMIMATAVVTFVLELSLSYSVPGLRQLLI